MFYLTDVNGPRVTNSPGFFGAADWVVKQMNDWGIPAHQEKWPFGRGWQFTHFSAHLIAPQYAPLIGYPQAWTSGTNGVVTGEPMFIEQLSTDADLEKYKGKIKGKIIMIGAARDLAMSTAANGRRYTDNELAEIALAPEPGAAGRGGRGPAGREFQQKLQKFLADEQPARSVASRCGTKRWRNGIRRQRGLARS